MAQIDTGSHDSQRRQTNRELPLVPFIDFLLCLVAFLLVTAVWTQMARINANAKVPGPPRDDEPDEIKPEKELHVEMRGDRKFQLVWKEGATVVNTIDVEKKQVDVGSEGDFRYPALAEKVASEWKSSGSHRSPSDTKFDRAVLHTDNSTPFSEVIAVIDAVYTPQRDFTFGGKTEKVPAFNLTFAVN